VEAVKLLTFTVHTLDLQIDDKGRSPIMNSYITLYSVTGDGDNFIYTAWTLGLMFGTCQTW